MGKEVKAVRFERGIKHEPFAVSPEMKKFFKSIDDGIEANRNAPPGRPCGRIERSWAKEDERSFLRRIFDRLFG